MRVPDDLLKCVFFIGTRDENGMPRWRGTGFFVSVPLEDRLERASLYVVTARHNIELARNENAQLCIRLNQPGGGSAVADINLTWVVDEAAAGSDIALATISIDGLVDYRDIPRSMLLTDEAAATMGIGIGDELGVVGLFTKRAGSSRNHPIVRFGTVAAMPGEPLRNRLTGAPFQGYLMELRSIAGLSGSPVFVILPYGRLNQDQTELSWRFHLLGLLHGHWGIQPREYLEMDIADGNTKPEEPLNTGIGVVVPATEILRLLDREDQLEKRKELSRREAFRDSPEIDVADASEAPGAEGG